MDDLHRVVMALRDLTEAVRENTAAVERLAGPREPEPELSPAEKERRAAASWGVEINAPAVTTFRMARAIGSGEMGDIDAIRDAAAAQGVEAKMSDGRLAMRVNVG